MRSAVKQVNLFGDNELGNEQATRPKEPLYSMLVTCHPESLAYLLDKLNNYDLDENLNDIFPEVGLSRRDYIAQVLLAKSDRGI